MKNKITLKVNGKAIAMNPFVKKIIGNVVAGGGRVAGPDSPAG